MWWQQFKKELQGHRIDFALIAGALLVWLLFLVSRVGAWSDEVILAIYWFPMGFLPIWALWTSVQLYRHEWRENTSYLMLSLPVRAWIITSAKLAVLVAGVVGFSSVILAGGLLLVERTGILSGLGDIHDLASVPLEWVFKMGLLGYAWSVGGIVLLALLAQWAYVFSRLFNRFQGLVMAWTWLVTFWLMGRVVDLGGRLLTWLPDFYLRMPDMAGEGLHLHRVALESGPFWALILFVVGLYTLLNLTVERAVEV